MRHNNRPKIGTKMYTVQEHLYYIPGYPAPVTEYCVCEGEVKRFFTAGYTEIILVGPSPEGYTTPYRYPLRKIGKRVFYTAEEAALLAKDMTERHEHTWGWIGEPAFPMRRPWEKYLVKEEN